MKKWFLILTSLFMLCGLIACGSEKVNIVTQNPEPSEPITNNIASSNINKATPEKQINITNEDVKSLQGNTSVSVQPLNKNETLTYSNKKLGFSISFPESWNGKYLCKETDWGVDVLYKARNTDNASLFQISLTTEIQYAIDEAFVGFMKQLGKRDSVVFTTVSPTGIPYDDKNEKYKDDSNAYFELFNNKEVVLDSFKIFPEYDVQAYNQFIELNKKKDESLKKDYDQLKQQEKK